MTASAPLTLVRLRPDLPALAAAAARHRLLPPRGDDLGYALHAALAALFGAKAPRPFALRQRERGGAELLGYTIASVGELRTLAALPGADGPEELRAALCPATLEPKPMPSAWPAALRLRFEVRLRPVLRTRQGRDGPVREHDAFLHARDAARAADTVPPEDREAVYRALLARELAREGAAELLGAELVAVRRLRVLRRPATPEGGRRPAAIEGPEARFAGTLRIADGDAFGRLVARGLGRHRAFGFGMLLLSAG